MNGPEPSARGNFTPPPRGAAPAQVPGPEPMPAPAPSGSRFSPRNWRVPTRLNAILLIPVVVGLVMGGFQVKSSIDTWQEAQDAEKTARLVQAALNYGDKLFVERDLSAYPLLAGKGQKDPTVVKLRKQTDLAADAFDQAAQDMPKTPGLERRLAVFRNVEPGLTLLRQAAYTTKLPGVKTEEGYLQIQHPLMEFANELGLGTGNITSYGRTVYAISLSKAALSLERSIGMHMLIKPGPDLPSQRVALSSYAYLEGIAVEEYIGGGTEADAAKLNDAQAQIKTDLTKQAQDAASADPNYVKPPSNPTEMVTDLAKLASPWRATAPRWPRRVSPRRTGWRSTPPSTTRTARSSRTSPTRRWPRPRTSPTRPRPTPSSPAPSS